MKNHSKKRGLLASVGALATAAALVLGGSVAASAAPTILPTETHGNLHITKLSTPNGGGVTSNGTQVVTLPTGAEPIQNVTFAAKRVISYYPTAGDPINDLVTVDLSTNAGWAAAAALQYDAVGDTWSTEPGAVAVTVNFGAISNDITDANGEAGFNLPIGLYHVEETVTPAGVTPAAPFLVTIPLTNPVTLNDWMYDVYVYPKNAQTSFTKSVNDENAYVAGDDVVWTLNADIPRKNNATSGPADWADITAFTISDTLDANLEFPAAADVVVNIVDATGANLGTQPALTTDYTLSAANPLVMTFNATGLAKLNAVVAANPGAQVKMTITTEVKDSVPVGTAMTIKNGGLTTSLQYTFDNGTPEDPQHPNEPETRFRSFTFEKVAHGTPATKLQNAVFGLYETEALAAAGAAGTALIESAPSTATGVVTFNDVRVSDFQNNEVQTAGAKANPLDPTCTLRNEDFRVYWLSELVAPTGYELLAKPLPVIVTTAGAVVQVAVDGAGYAQYNADCSPVTVANPLSQVQNVPANAGFVLPLTGGTGTVLLTVLGIGILAVVLVVARRRRGAEELAE
ncbi:MAG: SpaH/EbpB family LPXTG-anchored major pilin [Actinobacteria bacterium]|nr:SpaH/EbpB family LPXTG-anchored major pilin [Actinomycetota bacterium]